MISKIKINDNLKNNALPKRHSGNNVNFCGNARGEVEKLVKNEILEQSKFLKLFDYIFTKKGEVLNNVVNAIGTGLVAPIFIAYNPLSKEDDNTKKYSALRQPVSAVIAIIMQLCVVLQFDKLINYIASENGLGDKFDLSIEPDKNYLYEKIKNNAPKLSKKEIWAKVKEEQNRIKEAVTKEIEEHLNKLAKMKLDDRIKNAIPKLNTEVLNKLPKMSPEEIAEAAAKHFGSKLGAIKGRLGSFKAGIGIVVSLATMPAACTLLNWSYPRLVEKFFPSICKDCAKKGDKK